MEDKIDKIKKVGRKEAGLKTMIPEEELQRVAPNKERFDNMMQAPKPEKIVIDKQLEPSKKTTLMDEARRVNTKESKARVTPAELIAQIDQVNNQIDDIKGKLKTPGLEIKSSVNTLMRNKISHVDENIRIALSQTGSEVPNKAVIPVGPRENPISRFLGMLTDGQYRMQTIAGDVERMALNKHDINPATLLLVQIKVGYIQQELEFFAGLLNKALESTKTIMNVQV